MRFQGNGPVIFLWECEVVVWQMRRHWQLETESAEEWSGWRYRKKPENVNEDGPWRQVLKFSKVRVGCSAGRQHLGSTWLPYSRSKSGQREKAHREPRLQRMLVGGKPPLTRLSLKPATPSIMYYIDTILIGKLRQQKKCQEVEKFSSE